MVVNRIYINPFKNKITFNTQDASRANSFFKNHTMVWISVSCDFQRRIIMAFWMLVSWEVRATVQTSLELQISFRKEFFGLVYGSSFGASVAILLCQPSIERVVHLKKPILIKSIKSEGTPYFPLQLSTVFISRLFYKNLPFQTMMLLTWVCLLGGGW